MGEALLTTNYILNRVPYKKFGLIHFECWHCRAPSYHYLKMWRCLAKVLAPLPKKTKLRARTIDCIFIIAVLIDFWYINQKYQIFI